MECVKVITVVEVESPEVVMLVESLWESDGVGRDDRSGRSETSLETDGVDLGLADSVHRGDLVSEEVVSVLLVTGHPKMCEVEILTYPGAKPVGTLKDHRLVW